MEMNKCVGRKVSKEMEENLTIYRPNNARHSVPNVEKRIRNRGLQVNKFIHQNPEMAIRLLLGLCAVAILISCGVTRHRTEERLNEIHRQELTAARIQTEQEVLARVKEEYGINAENAQKELMEEQAKDVARVLYAMRDNREAGLHLACWAVFYRVDHVRYSDDLYSVCSADQAFMGWSDNNPVLDNLYSIALEEVQRWHRGIRPLDTAFVYLYWTPSEIYLFDDFGHRFYESDWNKYIDSISE